MVRGRGGDAELVAVVVMPTLACFGISPSLL